jgi:hypothetical protein
MEADNSSSRLDPPVNSDVAFTIEIDQLVNGHLRWKNPTNDPHQLERILLQALAYVQRELTAQRTASLLAAPRITTPNMNRGGGLPPDLRIR